MEKNTEKIKEGKPLVIEKPVVFEQIHSKIAMSNQFEGWAIEVSSSVTSLNDLKAFCHDLKKEFFERKTLKEKSFLGIA